MPWPPMNRSEKTPRSIGPEDFEWSRIVEADPGTVFCWHARAGAFHRLSPPWESVQLVAQTGGIEDGARVRLRLRAMGIPLYWDLEHSEYRFGEQFCDQQVRGPFKSWRHLHRFESAGSNQTRLVDRLAIELPVGALGRWVGRHFLRKQLQRLFQYRHDVTSSDLALLVERENMNKPSLKILVTGSSGLIGQALVPFLTTQGHQVVTLGRQPDRSDPNAFSWDPDGGEIDSRALENVDAVIHLAGSNLAAGRWTSARKREIRESRVRSTRVLVDAMARAERPVATLVSSSAIGYYGDTGEHAADESAPLGRGFLADLCRDWEAEALKAAEGGTRVVLMRTGVVLTPKGGALGSLLPVFRKGTGGRVGNGKQWMSWISMDDLAAAFLHAVETPELEGPCNGISPGAVRNADFTEILAGVINRPAALPVPRMALRLLFGQMADETLLASCRVVPGVLEQTGFQFRFPDLEGTLRHCLGQAPKNQNE